MYRNIYPKKNNNQIIYMEDIDNLKELIIKVILPKLVDIESDLKFLEEEVKDLSSTLKYLNSRNKALDDAN